VLEDYYRERAPEYDAIYAKPERQEDLGRLRALLVELVAGKSVLEIAAGTGYWTTALSTSARSIVATDLNDETLEIARSRRYGPGGVVVLAGNRYVEGSSQPITRTAETGDTYQSRRLADGREFEVLKNFPDSEQVVGDLSPVAAEVNCTDLTYFWLATFTT
jgi:SAM-dependent methyltransferase